MDLLHLLCCPECKGSLSPHPAVLTPGGRIKSGALECARCGVVGAIRNFKYDFIHFDRTRAGQFVQSRSRPVVLPFEVRDITIRWDDARLTKRGTWQDWEGAYAMSEGRDADSIRFEGTFTDVGVRILRHPWSGRVQFRVDGQVVDEADLYQAEWSTIDWIPIASDLAPRTHVVEVIATGEKNPASAATQVFLAEFVATCPDPSAKPNDPAPLADVNRVLPYWDELKELWDAVPADGAILDCGGGDRSVADPRYVNIEFIPYQLPSVYGDTLKLPFRTDSFDLVISQAVLEHVRNPFAAVEEMRRVTKPGATVWAAMAFMQPVHAVPSHYFNATVYGIEELFRHFRIDRLSWFGTLSSTVDWMMKTSGVPKKMPDEEYRELMRKLEEIDKLITWEELKGIASGVNVRAVKI